MLASTPLLSLWRQGTEEVRVDGLLVVSDGKGVVAASSDDVRFCQVPARSILKPFQFAATGLVDGSTELDSTEAAACGSISGTQQQLMALQQRYEATLEQLAPQLVIRPSVPMADGSDGTPTLLANPCFSKHAHIFAACRQQGWPTQGYHEQSHPYFRALLDVLEPLLGRTPNFVTDGCRLPTPLVTPLELAELYRHLVAQPADTPLGKITHAMQTHPEWVGGPGRVDSELMRANPGTVLAKEGADGLLVIGVKPSASHPQGLGLALKFAAGYQPRFSPWVVEPFFREWELELLPQPKPTDQTLHLHVGPGSVPLSTLDASPRLRESIAIWPGDVPFERQVSSTFGQVEEGSSPLVVSSIRTTLHVGTHTDAPNHFVEHGLGISEVPLDIYSGQAQVLRVPTARNALVNIQALEGQQLLAPRLLLSTGTFPDPDTFNEDFAGVTPELVRWLIERGVLLLGIDTPSLDAFDSKRLPAHHATRHGSGLAILEGLVLDHVAPGVYDFSALPLNLEGGDASPVRVVLRTHRPPGA